MGSTLAFWAALSPWSAVHGCGLLIAAAVLFRNITTLSLNGMLLCDIFLSTILCLGCCWLALHTGYQTSAGYHVGGFLTQQYSLKIPHSSKTVSTPAENDHTQ